MGWTLKLVGSGFACALGLATFGSMRSEAWHEPGLQTPAAAEALLSVSEVGEQARAEWLARLLDGSRGFTHVALPLKAPAEVQSVAQPINCGDGLAAYTERKSHPPECGATPLDAQVNVALAVLALLMKGKQCTTCPVEGACTLGISTLPEGWSFGTPFQGGFLCGAEEWSVSGAYEGAYILHCSPCPLDQVE